MLDVLIKAGCYVSIIILGWALRRGKILPENSFSVLSKIVINVTLPAAIISGTSGKAISPSMLTIALLGLGCGVAYVLLGALLNRKKGRDTQAFAMLNAAGYNIGNFALPFTQSFLGPVGVVTASLFDIGNSFVCLGGAYGAASAVKEGGSGGILRVLKAPLRSVPFLAYVLMAVLNLLGLVLPRPVVSLAEIAGNANPFLGMLMVGVGFHLTGDKRQTGTIVRILSLRFGLAAVLAAVCYFLLPFDLGVRKSLVVLVFSPIGSAVPAFTERIKGDVGLSSAINSISIVCSVILIVTMLLIMP